MCRSNPTNIGVDIRFPEGETTPQAKPIDISKLEIGCLPFSSQVLTIDREALLQLISQAPELPYYQIARSIGITYEEFARLFKQLKGILVYQRGGKIIVRDWQKLIAVAQSSTTNSDRHN